jgi:hypothetical protein
MYLFCSTVSSSKHPDLVTLPKSIKQAVSFSSSALQTIKKDLEEHLENRYSVNCSYNVYTSTPWLYTAPLHIHLIPSLTTLAPIHSTFQGSSLAGINCLFCKTVMELLFLFPLSSQCLLYDCGPGWHCLLSPYPGQPRLCTWCLLGECTRSNMYLVRSQKLLNRIYFSHSL